MLQSFTIWIDQWSNPLPVIVIRRSSCFRFIYFRLHFIRFLHFKLLSQDLLFWNKIRHIVGLVANLLPLLHNVVVEMSFFIIFVRKLINIVTVIRSLPVRESVISYHNLQAKVFQGFSFSFVAVTKRHRVNFLSIVHRFLLRYFAETVLFTVILRSVIGNKVLLGSVYGAN